MSDHDPTDLGDQGAAIRPADHRELGDGATRDPAAILAFRRSCAARRKATARTATAIGPRRHFSAEEHQRSEALRREAQGLRAVAAAKPHRDQAQVVEREALRLERMAEQIVPARHARSC